MRKLERITLNKNLVNHSDILGKKEMNNLRGGLWCTFSCNGVVEGFRCHDWNDCYDQFGDICEYGGGLSCS